MNKACQNFGPDLLMLVHGELKGWARLRLELHLAHCPSCRAQRRRMGSLTLSLSHLFQNPSLGYRTFGAVPRFGWTTMAIAALFVAGGSWMTVDTLNHGTTSSAPAAGFGSLKACDLHPQEGAVALSKKRNGQHPKRKHDNPDK